MNISYALKNSPYAQMNCLNQENKVPVFVYTAIYVYELSISQAQDTESYTELYRVIPYCDIPGISRDILWSKVYTEIYLV